MVNIKGKVPIMQSKKQLAQRKIQAWQGRLSCPLCQEGLNQEVQCPNKHQFNLAKQGYINLAPNHQEKHYTAELFQARQRIMGQGQLYGQCLAQVAQAVAARVSSGPLYLADLGTGEGSHLLDFLNQFEGEAVHGLGLDLAKAGIQTAAKQSSQALWAVADLAQIPLADKSLDLALTILSPSNYQEVKRVLKPGAPFIKIIPGPNYLVELRQLVLDKDDVSQDPSQSRQRFQANFANTEVHHYQDQVAMTPDGMADLIQMTPLMWHAADPARQAALKLSEISIDLEILIGESV
ncbi:methyltransferase domain-containing protein [Aerococcus sanguinicola]|uniref:Methyltransferase domain-containing protein n=2 Tax=Aerococcaceae TaxID=186827 RepID=A0A5N1GKF1_9LACT|nr:methyltransferase domain-containing protein [Aerococcus sanguinicola]